MDPYANREFISDSQLTAPAGRKSTEGVDSQLTNKFGVQQETPIWENHFKSGSLAHNQSRGDSAQEAAYIASKFIQASESSDTGRYPTDTEPLPISDETLKHDFKSELSSTSNPHTSTLKQKIAEMRQIQSSSNFSITDLLKFKKAKQADSGDSHEEKEDPDQGKPSQATGGEKGTGISSKVHSSNIASQITSHMTSNPQSNTLSKTQSNQGGLHEDLAEYLSKGPHGQTVGSSTLKNTMSGAHQTHTTGGTYLLPIKNFEKVLNSSSIEKHAQELNLDSQEKSLAAEGPAPNVQTAPFSLGAQKHSHQMSFQNQGDLKSAQPFQSMGAAQRVNDDSSEYTSSSSYYEEFNSDGEAVGPVEAAAQKAALVPSIEQSYRESTRQPQLSGRNGTMLINQNPSLPHQFSPQSQSTDHQPDQFTQMTFERQGGVAVAQGFIQNLGDPPSEQQPFGNGGWPTSLNGTQNFEYYVQTSDEASAQHQTNDLSHHPNKSMTVIQEETALEESSRVVEASKRSTVRRKGKKKKKMGKSMVETKKSGISKVHEKKKMAQSHNRKGSTLTNGFPLVVDHQLLQSGAQENMQSSSGFPMIPASRASQTQTGGLLGQEQLEGEAFGANLQEEESSRENNFHELSALEQFQQLKAEQALEEMQALNHQGVHYEGHQGVYYGVHQEEQPSPYEEDKEIEKDFSQMEGDHKSNQDLYSHFYTNTTHPLTKGKTTDYFDTAQDGGIHPDPDSPMEYSEHQQPEEMAQPYPPVQSLDYLREVPLQKEDRATVCIQEEAQATPEVLEEPSIDLGQNDRSAVLCPGLTESDLLDDRSKDILPSEPELNQTNREVSTIVVLEDPPSESSHRKRPLPPLPPPEASQRGRQLAPAADTSAAADESMATNKSMVQRLLEKQHQTLRSQSNKRSEQPTSPKEHAMAHLGEDDGPETFRRLSCSKQVKKRSAKLKERRQGEIKKIKEKFPDSQPKLPPKHSKLKHSSSCSEAFSLPVTSSNQTSPPRYIDRSSYNTLGLKNDMPLNLEVADSRSRMLKMSQSSSQIVLPDKSRSNYNLETVSKIQRPMKQSTIDLEDEPRNFFSHPNASEMDQPSHIANSKSQVSAFMKTNLVGLIEPEGQSHPAEAANMTDLSAGCPQQNLMTYKNQHVPSILMEDASQLVQGNNENYDQTNLGGIGELSSTSNISEMLKNNYQSIYLQKKESLGKQSLPIEHWILQAHKQAKAIQELQEQLKEVTKAKNLEAEDHELALKQKDQAHLKQMKVAEKELDRQREKRRQADEAGRVKVAEVRERMKNSQKLIFEQVEKEYEVVVKQKEKEISGLKEEVDLLQKQTKGQEQELISLREAWREEEPARIHKEMIMQQKAEERERQHQREMSKERREVREKGEALVDKEIARIREILDQELEYKIKTIKEGFEEKEKLLKRQLEEEKQEFTTKNEQEYDHLKTVKLEQERMRMQATATQDLYDDISRNLRERFEEGEKAKMLELSKQMKANFEDKITKLDLAHQKEKAKDQKKIAMLELELAKMEEKMACQGKMMDAVNMELDKNRTIQQQLTNLQPMKGLDGNCKRCEALIFMNGSYIEKINKLKKKLGLTQAQAKS